MQRLSQRHGLTLIELLVMLAIIVILTLTSIPLFTSLVEYYRISTAAEELYSSLQYARTEAVKQNTNVYVSIITGDTWCYGINSASTCDCSTPGSCNLGTVNAPAAQLLSLSATGLSSNSFYFDSKHGGASGSVTVTFTLFGQSSLIRTSIGRLGNITVCSTGISGYTGC